MRLGRLLPMVLLLPTTAGCLVERRLANPEGLPLARYVDFWLFEVPEGIFWQFLVGLLIAYFVTYRIQKRLARSKQWSEKQVEAYMGIAHNLWLFKNATHKFGQKEDAREDPAVQAPHLSEEEWQRLDKERNEAHRAIEREVQRGQFLLSARALGVLESYLQDMVEYEDSGTTTPHSWMRSIGRHRYQDFYEVSRVDLDADPVWLWWARRGWRSLRFWFVMRRHDIQSRYHAWNLKREQWLLGGAFERQNGRKMTQREFFSVRDFRKQYGRIPREEELQKHMRGESI